MLNLYKRFGINIDASKSQMIFRNKVNNLLLHSAEYQKLSKDLKAKDQQLEWQLCNRLGYAYEYPSDTLNHYLREHLDFGEYLFNLQIIIDLLEENFPKQGRDLAKSVQEFLEQLPINLAVKVTFPKNKTPQLLRSSAKFLDEKLVTDLLGFLEKNKSYITIEESFKEGLTEFLKANSKQQLKDVVEDMLTALDASIQIKFADTKSGLGRLLKDKLKLERLNLNNWQKQMLDTLNDWMNKIKHNGFSDYEREDVEQIVFLSAIFIKFIANKEFKS